MSAVVVRIDAVTGGAGRIGNLVNYLDSPAMQSVSERVVYREVGNMLATSTYDVAQEMRIVADAAREKDSRVSEDPFEHFVISFGQGDAVADKEYKQAIQSALKHLGYEQHQYLAAVHDDTDNRHIHLVVSRIDPETLQAKALPFAVKQAEQIGALINHSLDMPAMQNNRYHVNELGQVERKEQQAVAQPDKLADIIKGARSWGEFHERTSEIGINYERKGSGAMINGVKASDIDRNASLAKLIKKFGEYQPPLTHESEKPHVSKITNHNDQQRNSEYRKEFAPDNLRKLSECNLAETRERKSTDLLQTDARISGRQSEPVRRSEPARRAIERAADRDALADQQRAERTAIYQDYKAKKSEVWTDKKIPRQLRSGILSVLAADQAKALADIRDSQKHQRDDLRNNLNRDKPLLQKHTVANQISGERVAEVKHSDIRNYKHFLDESSQQVHYSMSDGDKAAFIDRGKHVSIIDRSDDAVHAALQLAAVKFGKGMTLTGGDDFKAQAVRICVANGITIANPELQDQIQAERERLTKERQSMSTTKYEALDAFKALADAVPAQRWRVTLGSYVEVQGKDGKPWTPTSVLRDEAAPALTETGAGKGNDGLSVEQIAKRWGYIEHAQRDITKSRVILTPASDKLHIVHIDDVSSDALARLKKDGYTMAAVIRTSEDKRNVIITCPKDKELNPQQQHEVQKALSQTLNKEYGDPQARNAVQPFRAPAFDNLKPKYQQANGSYPKIVLEHAQRGDCGKLQALARQIAESTVIKQVVQREPVHAARPVQQVKGAALTMETRAYIAHAQSIRKDGAAGKLKLRTRKDGTFDQSAIDVLAAQRMRMTGWTSAQIVGAVANGCNQVRGANGDPEKSNPLEFAKFANDVASKIDLAPLAHQVKYRVKDEQAAGVTPPVVQAKQMQQAGQAPQPRMDTGRGGM